MHKMEREGTKEMRSGERKREKNRYERLEGSKAKTGSEPASKSNKEFQEENKKRVKKEKERERENRKPSVFFLLPSPAPETSRSLRLNEPQRQALLPNMTPVQMSLC